MTRRSAITGALIICLLLLQAAGRAQTATTPDFRAFLHELTNRESLARFPDGQWTLHQVSSYDRRSTGKNKPGWFANDDWDGYIRKENNNGKDEYVMMDEDGPGVITRFWVAGHPNKKAHLRFYIDGQTTPFWEADHTGALIGQNKDIGSPLSQRSVDQDFLPINEGAQPGHNLYAPIPFRRHIKITCDKAPGGADKGFWYNINFRKYQKTYAVKSFSSETPSTYKKELDETNKELDGFMDRPVSGAVAPGETKVAKFDFSLDANGSRSFELNGMLSVRRILLGIKNAGNDAAKNLWLKITFDGTETVNTPAGFLFGCGDQLVNSKDWYSKADSTGNMAVYWVMPFRKKAVVQLTNRGSAVIAGSLQLATGSWQWNNSSMYFHAAFRDMPDYQTTAQVGTDFNMLTRKSKSGVYVGEVLQVNKKIGGWWGEGDEKIYIDGSGFPDHFGTGTEDYFGYAWGHPETFNHIFNSQPIGDANRNNVGGTTVNSRKRSLDAIPFSSSLIFDMESWNWHGGPVNFKWTCMWYELPSKTAAAAVTDVLPVVDIRENLYAGWQPVKENKQVHASLFNGYTLVNNGTAFGESPAQGAFEEQDAITGYQGNYLANSKNKNLGTTVGELLSDTFTIKGDKIDFLIAGGNFDSLAGIGLIINNKTVRFSTGDFSNDMKRRSWDVAEFKNNIARLMILDKIARDPFCFPPFDSTKDKFGYILVDDIRQTDANGKRIDSLYDQEHNFNFEKERPSQYSIRSRKIADSAAFTVTQIDVFTANGVKKGTFTYKQTRKALNGSLQELTHQWDYSGDSLQGIKLKVVNTIPVGPKQTQYYVLPGLLYNGNNIGIKAHYLNENMPEDASTVPGGYSVEDSSRVFAGWVRPQQSPDDPRFSIELKRSGKEDHWQAIYSVPESINMAVHDTAAQDEDHRFDVGNGFSLKKTTYLYTGKKNKYALVSNERTGYQQMISEAWKQLYPLSATNPPYTLTDDYNLKMKTLLDPKSLVQDETVNGKKYRIWIVGRFILGDDFDFSKSKFVPTKYIFNYTGFSWSGMLEVAAYNGIKEYLRTKDTTALSLAVSSIDFFADNGMSPIGILYPNWDSAIGFSSVWAKELIDIGHLGDGLSGIIRCYRLMKDSGVAIKSNWLNVVSASLDNIMKRFPDGDVPGRIHGNSGEAAVRDGIPYTRPSIGGPNGINFLIWAYCDYYKLTKEKKYLDYARKMGDIVIHVMNKYGVMSGMEADYFNVDKRMFHGALAAFNRLYENTSDKKWLEASIQAGNAFGSWEYCYNVNFKAYPETPNGHYDYRSVGGTPVDIKYSTNNTNFQQGATEFLKLWKSTGDQMWFERARAIMHQGTQLSLTEEKRKWLNENFQTAGSNTMSDKNPSNTFDPHVLGGGTEDVMMSWLFKGIWTSKYAGIISMYMLTQGFESDDLLHEYGGLCYNYKCKNGGAIDALDEVKFTMSNDNKSLAITARNMLAKTSVYMLKLLGVPGSAVNINGKTYSRREMDKGVPIPFNAHEKKTITVQIL